MTIVLQTQTHSKERQAAVAAAGRRSFTELDALDRYQQLARPKSPSWGIGPEPALARPEGSTILGGESYSQSMARLFHVETAQTATTTTLRTTQLAVTRVSSPVRGVGISSPMPPERAYFVMLQLRDTPGAALLKGGRAVAAGPFTAGSIAIACLEDEPTVDLPAPFDALFIYIPQIAFDELADDHGAPRINALSDAAGVPDPVVHGLGQALTPFLAAPDHGSDLFFDHVAFAIHSRLASRYGQSAGRLGPRPGALSARQERIAKAALAADLASEPSLEDVARACGLSVSRLVRGFRQATGMPPYRWLRRYRVERTKDLLLNSPLALAQIAYECGFADQSHFTRVFTAAVGTTPGAWRRARRA